MAAPTIPKGSLVLVTGATGFVAAHIIKAFLAHGYKVRGTVRDTTKASWLVTDVFRAYAERGDLELAVVPDLAAPHAWDEAVKGVAAIAHVASVVTLDTDPAKVIPQTVLGATSIMDAALKEPPVKEFVYTSSIVASVMQVVGLDAHVSKDSWNDAAVKMAWDPATKSGGVVYMASKVEAEKAVWKFVEEKNPHFGVNSVCPSTIMGEPLHESHLKTGSAWLKQLVDKKLDNLMWTPALYHVDVKDVAELHVAAVLDPEVNGERLQAWAENTNWNEVLAVLRKQYPERDWLPDIESLPKDEKLSITAHFTQPLALLKKWAGQDGWISLEQTLKDNMKGIDAFAK